MKPVNDHIDIVLLWVDGNDEKWLKEKNKYLDLKGDAKVNRFRDCDNLQYLFRGIEKYAPWVNKVFFITWGHIPKWLNTDNEKLVIVKHEDFIPKEYLPTFNSNAIEMNLHRIEALSEKFILFNDDLFILKKINPKDFFEKNLPKDMYIEYIKKNCSNRHIIMRKNYMDIVNKYIEKEKFIKKNIHKIFNIRYGFQNLSTLINLKNKSFLDLYNPHLTQAFLKSTFDIVWEKEYSRINEACYNKFRADNDLGTTLCKYWQLLNGNFKPGKKLGKYFSMSNNNEQLIKTIRKRKYKIICINDSDNNVDFERAKKEINEAFEKTLNYKSKFELE